uniref:28 kDa heat-and acid-stable phosphoprotein n=1 Tax=Lepeophtheirus salmonis TaxID=72036 RepID=C1BU71_LEPSM|nr:28 kDa heat- and acid-stable phosphoprotein [Lepeophtheirus salmonis]
MARGGKRGHKGGRRQFTNPQALEQQQLKLQKEKAWRKQRGEEDSDDESEDDAEDSKEKEEGETSSSEEEETSSEEESEEEGAKRSNGTSGLIEIENPNRAIQKHKKVTSLTVDADGAPQLSRREREEIQKHRAKEQYDKLHREGKTDEARADLTRLAIIHKQREEAAKKREEDKKSKEEAVSQRKDTTAKALGKR